MSGEGALPLTLGAIQEAGNLGDAFTGPGKARALAWHAHSSLALFSVPRLPPLLLPL